MRPSAIPQILSAAQKRCVMSKLVASAVLAALTAYPALAQSRDSSFGQNNIDGSVITAPAGHRQPRAGDLPATNTGDNPSAYARDEKLDRALRICRGC
jgi:hypothetical protein